MKMSDRSKSGIQRRGPAIAYPGVMSRVQWVDIARGIAIIAVVLFHATITLEEADLAWKWRRISDLVATFRMPLFFFASGLVSAKLLTQPATRIFRTRVAYFVYLYALWVVLRVVIAKFVHTPGNPRGWHEAALMFTHPHSSLWFIYALAIFSTLAWATRRLPAWLPVVGALALSLAFELDLFAFLPDAWTKPGRYIFFFVAGIYLRRIALGIAERITLVPAAVTVAIYAAVACAWVITPLSNVTGARTAIASLAVAAGICLSVLLARHTMFDWLAYLGRNTLPVYLLHGPILVVTTLALIGAEITIPHPWVAGAAPIATAIATTLSLVVYRVTRRVPGLYDAPWNRTTSLPTARSSALPQSKTAANADRQ